MAYYDNLSISTDKSPILKGGLSDTSKPLGSRGVTTGGAYGSGPQGQIQDHTSSNDLVFGDVPNDPNLTLGGASSPRTSLVSGGAEVPPTVAPSTTVRVPNVDSEIDAPTLSDSYTSNNLDISNSVNTAPPSTTNIEAQAASITQTYFDSVQEKQKAQNSSSASERQAAADRGTDELRAKQDIEGARDKITDLENEDPEEEFKTALEENLEALGVDMSEFTSLANEVGKLQGDLQRLNAEELKVTEDARLRGESGAFASGQVAQERHRFAVERAGLSAELGARAALLQALQGRFETANGMAKEIVDNAYLARQTKMDNLNDFIDRNEDLLDEISKAEASALKESRDREEASLKEDKDNATRNISYMNSDPSAFRASGLTTEDLTTMSNADFAARIAQYSTKGTGATTGKVYTSKTIPGDIRNSVISDLQNKSFAIANGELTLSQLSQLYPEVTLDTLRELMEEFYDYDTLTSGDETAKTGNWFTNLFK